MRDKIVHETTNLFLWKTKSGLEIHLQGNTHAWLVGKPKSVEAGKRFMENVERYPKNLKFLVP